MIKKKLKKVIPDKLILRFMQFKHLTKTKLQENKTTNVERKKITSLSKLQNPPALLAGYTKSGNTWLRFLIYNYFNIIITDAKKTLSYSELNNDYQSDSIGTGPRVKDKHRRLDGNKTGFPNIIRTHSHFKRPYHLFNKILYISRNPLDVLVSNFHFYIRNRGKLDGVTYPLNNINSYVLFNLPLWVHHVNSYLNNDRVFHITYEELKKDSSESLRRVFEYLGYEDINEKALIKSAEYSSFDSIKKMGRTQGEQEGMAPKGSYKGEFTRKGKVGGYEDELKNDTILQAQKILNKYGLAYKIEI